MGCVAGLVGGTGEVVRGAQSVMGAVSIKRNEGEERSHRLRTEAKTKGEVVGVSCI